MNQVTTFVVLLLVWQRLGGAQHSQKIEYHWSTNSSGLEYHNRFCTPIHHEHEDLDVDTNAKCFPCSSKVTCKIYGTCCPDKELSWAQSIFDEVDALYEKSHNVSDVELIKNSASQQDFERFSCVYLGSNGEDPLLIVDECHQPEENTTLRDLCTQNLTDTFRSYTPVTSVRTGVTYRNTYCYQCNDGLTFESPAYGQSEESFESFQSQGNGDSPDNMTSWGLLINCDHFQTLYRITSRDEFLRTALNNANNCSVEFSPPSNVTVPESCASDWYLDPEPYHYTSCQNSDLKLLWYCLHIRHPAFRTTFGYHSLFCMLCEGQTPIKVVPGHQAPGSSGPSEHSGPLGPFGPFGPFGPLGTLGHASPFGTGGSIVPSGPSSPPVHIPPLSLLLRLTNANPPEKNLHTCSNTT